MRRGSISGCEHERSGKFFGGFLEADERVARGMGGTVDEPINEAPLGGGETGQGQRVAGGGRDGDTAVFNKLRQRRESIPFRETIKTQEGKVAFGENQVADVDRNVVGPLCLEEADRARN